MLQLWFSRIGDTEEIERSTENQLSDTEQKRLSSTRSHNKRREFLLSRALMRHALSQQFSCPTDQWSFTERVNLPPKINNLPNDFYTSLSHSKGLICFAISNSPVGIDIEVVNKEKDFIKLAETFMNEHELQTLKTSSDKQAETFYRIWCIKEAYYKALPENQQSNISYKNIPTQALSENKTEWSLVEDNIDESILSVIIKNRPESISYNHYP